MIGVPMLFIAALVAVLIVHLEVKFGALIRRFDTLDRLLDEFASAGPAQSARRRTDLELTPRHLPGAFPPLSLPHSQYQGRLRPRSPSLRIWLHARLVGLRSPALRLYRARFEDRIACIGLGAFGTAIWPQDYLRRGA